MIFARNSWAIIHGARGVRVHDIRATVSAVTALAGEPASGDVEVTSDLPFRADFVYSRTADVRIKEMIVTRVR